MINTYHAAPVSCSDHAVALRRTAWSELDMGQAWTRHAMCESALMRLEETSPRYKQGLKVGSHYQPSLPNFDAIGW